MNVAVTTTFLPTTFFIAFTNIVMNKMFSTHVRYTSSTVGDATCWQPRLQPLHLHSNLKLSLRVALFHSRSSCAHLFSSWQNAFHNVPSPTGSTHAGRDPILRALANALSAGDVQPSGGEEGIVGSLNTVLLCGCIPKCFFVCVRGRCTILIYSRPHTPEVTPRLLCLF